MSVNSEEDFQFDQNDSIAYNNDSMMPIDFNMNEQAASSLMSADLLAKFRDMTTANGGGSDPLSHSPQSPMSGSRCRITLPSMGATSMSPGAHPSMANAPELASLESPNHVPGQDPPRPSFISVGDAGANQLSSSTVVVIAGSHNAKDGGSGNSTILPTPSGAHSGNQKIVFMDAERVQEAQMARDWRQRQGLAEQEVGLPVSTSKGHFEASMSDSSTSTSLARDSLSHEMHQHPSMRHIPEQK